MLIDQLPTPFLLLGDMNARSPLWGEPIADHRGHIFEELFLERPLSLLNDDSPTHFHIQTNTLSIIDLSICSSDCTLDFHFQTIQDLSGSDHYPILIKINNPVILADSPNRYNVKRADWNLFHRHTLTQLNAHDIADINNLTDTITASIKHAATLSIPIISGNNRRPSVPWFTNECKNAKRARLRAERSYRRHRDVHHKIAYNREKANCRLVFRTAQKSSWQQYVSSINSRLSPHKLWKRVQKIAGKFRPSPTPLLILPHNNIVQVHGDVATLLAEHFSSVSGDHNYSAEFLRHKNATESVPLRFNTARAHNYKYNTPFTFQEYQSALNSSTEGSPGPDQITYSMLKHLHPSFSELILALFNRIFIEQNFPVTWLSSIIIPIAKPGKDPSKQDNYRPISLTNCLCKLLEKMVNLRLIWILETENHISTNQSGFRPRRCTTDNLIQFDYDVKTAMQLKQHTIAIYFDIQKAYDTAWRRGVLQTLYSFGLRGHLPSFVQNFLSVRNIQVRVGRSLSRSFVVPEGIPQGSVLSCTCFLIAINSIADSLPASVKSNVYVDDFMLYSSGANPVLIECRLQLALNTLSSWSNQTGFQFSPTKTVCMHICRRQNCPKLNCQLTFRDRPLRCVDTYKYLGLVIDNSYTWRQHIQQLRNSCTKTLNLLKVISHKQWGGDRASLLRLYIMLIKPKIDYGSEVYSSASTSLLNTLPPIQNAALRLATGAFRSSPILSIHAECGIKPLSYFRDIKLLNCFLRIYSNPTHPLYELSRIIGEEEGEEIAVAPPRGTHYFKRIQFLTQLYNIQFPDIIDELPPAYPLWCVDNLSCCTDLFDIPKKSIPSEQFRQLFIHHAENHSTDICIYSDGSKDEDSVSFAYLHNNHEFSQRIQHIASIFTAELRAIYDCLNYVNNLPVNHVTIFTDSRSAIQAIMKYPSTNSLAQLIRCRIINLDRPVCLCWVPSHIGVELNERADRLARTALRHQVHPVPLPVSDYKNQVKRVVAERWQHVWRNVRPPENKYRSISESTRPLSDAQCTNRSWSTKLCRLRIGHTSLTHSYLMSADPPPYCNDCIVPLTVAHFVTECPSYVAERNLHFGPGPYSLNRLLISPYSNLNGPLHKYLIQTNLISLI